MTWEPVDLSQALVVIGFPSIGLVGNIAAAHLVKSLGLREVGSILSPLFPPTAAVHDGISVSPVRIFLGDVVCGPDGSCEQLCVVYSEITPPPRVVAALADALISWGKECGARQVVCLESFTASDVAGENVRVFGVASDAGARQLIDKLGIPPMDDTLVTGVGGVALYTARARGLQALCLLAESREDFPDARGAARLLELLHPLVPLVPIDEQPLYAQAQVFGAVFREQMERSNRATKDLSRQAEIMFG